MYPRFSYFAADAIFSAFSGTGGGGGLTRIGDFIRRILTVFTTTARFPFPAVARHRFFTHVTSFQRVTLTKFLSSVSVSFSVSYLVASSVSVSSPFQSCPPSGSTPRGAPSQAQRPRR